MNAPLQPEVGPRITFSSVLEGHHRGELERLFFLNPRQALVADAIRAAVARHGLPRLRKRRGALCLALEGCPEAQNLFALELRALHSRLVGCVVYLREGTDRLTIAHLAVDPDFTLEAAPEQLPLAAQLVAQVTAIAHRIKGVREVELPYSGGRLLRV